MFYVSTPYYGCKEDIGYRLVDFDTKEEQLVSRSEVIQRVESGETIIGVCKKDNNYIIQTKGKAGQISLEDYAILKGRMYLIDEFDCEKNHTTPDKVAYTGHKKVWWECPKGHLYESAVYERTRCDGKNTGCPYCSSQKVLSGFNDFETYCYNNNLDYLLDEWDYGENTVLPSQIAPFSNKDVHWICPEKRHRYKGRLYNRIEYNSGCPYCNSSTSFSEQSVFFYIKTYLNAQNQYRYDNKYEIDVYLLDYKIGIEYDGVAWHSSDDSVRRDEEKNKVLFDADIQLIRLREEGCPIIEKYGSKEIIVQDLDDAIKELLSLISSQCGVSINIDVNTKRDRQTILAEYRSSKQEQSIKVTHPQVASEWCYEKNGDLKPEMFTAGSEEKVWWLCRICGNTYQALIGTRCREKSGCPSCAKISAGLRKKTRFSDFPEIETFWSKENPIMSEVSFSTHAKLLICCPECGFTEKARLDQRIKSQNGLTCKRCGYHVDVQKWNKERDEYIKQQESTESLYDDFQSFLKSQGK